MNNSKSLQVKGIENAQRQENFQQFLHLIADLGCIITENDCYEQINGSYWKNLLGWDELELIGKPMLVLVKKLISLSIRCK